MEAVLWLVGMGLIEGSMRPLKSLGYVSPDWSFNFVVSLENDAQQTPRHVLASSTTVASAVPLPAHVSSELYFYTV